MANRSILIKDIPKEVYNAISDRIDRLTNRLDSNPDEQTKEEATSEIEILNDFYNLDKEIPNSIDLIQKD